VLENEQNKQFTDNVKGIDTHMSIVEGYIENLKNEKVSLDT